MSSRALSRRSYLAIALALVALVATMLPTVPKAEASHGPCVLDVFHSDTSGVQTDDFDEEDQHSVGESHTSTAQLVLPDPTGGTRICAAATTINVDVENEGGANDADGLSYNSPDFTCDIPPGQASCTFGYTGFRTGTDQLRAWIDHDGIQSNPDDDRTEGLREEEQPGTGRPDCNSGLPEPDCTDVVAVHWVGGAPFSLDCDDPNGPDTERETNPSGGGSASDETYTCFARDINGGPAFDFEPEDPFNTAQRVFVYGEVENGVNDPDPNDDPGAAASYRSPDYGCTIANSGANAGSCNITVTQNEGETGTAEICFWMSSSSDPDAPGGAGEQGFNHCANEPTSENQNNSGGVPTSDSGNDFADQVELTWTTATGAQVDAEPEAATNQVGDPHTITAYVFDQFGLPSTGNRTVSFEFVAGSVSDRDGNTPETPDGFCATNATDRCQFTYSSPTGGSDAICVWINNLPSMPSTSTLSNPTCDGEGPNDADDDPNIPDPASPEDDQDVVRKFWQGPEAASRLDCSPETATTTPGSTHTLTCRATTRVGGISANVAIDVELAGANDSDGDSTLSPDRSCTTSADGSCSITHTTTSTAPTGVTTYRAWIDSDNSNATVEADATEGRDEGAQPGSRQEPDDTDVTENTWTGASPTPTPTPTTTTSPTSSPTTTRSPSPTACPGCQFARTVTLTATKNRVRFGSSFTLTGRVATSDAAAPASCTTGVPVLILRDELGDAQQTFTQVGTATSGSGGAFAVNFQADKNAIYIARVNANTPPGCNEATSDPESVLVRVKVGLNASRRSVARGGIVRLSARVTPCAGHESDTIVLFASTGGGKFGRVDKKRSSSSCTVSFRRRVSQRTVFQARWPRQDDDHIQGKSRRKTVRTT